MLTVKLAKNMMENEEGMNHILIRMKPETNQLKNTKPVAFFLVVDVSGSMYDFVGNRPFNSYQPFNPHAQKENREFSRKLDYVKQASERLVDTMRSGDKLGLVAFSDIATLESELIDLTKENKAFLKDRIRALKPRGSTNVSGGLTLAFQNIPEEIKKTHHIKLILLSDGEANHGITDPDNISSLAHQYFKEGVSISTIGVGNDYNSFFMESIATASCGMFYHLKNLESLNDIFTKELEELTQLTTKNVRITIKTPSGVHISPNLNGFSEDRNGEIVLGNLFNEQHVVSEIFTEKKIDNKKESITIYIEYLDINDHKKTIETSIELLLTDEENMDDVKIDEEVTTIVKKLLEAKTKKDALRFYELGDMQTIHQNMEQSFSKINKLQVSYQLDTSSFANEMNQFKETLVTNQLDKGQAKALYSASYANTRNITSEEKK